MGDSSTSQNKISKSSSSFTSESEAWHNELNQPKPKTGTQLKHEAKYNGEMRRQKANFWRDIAFTCVSSFVAFAVVSAAFIDLKIAAYIWSIFCTPIAGFFMYRSYQSETENKK